MAYHAVAPFTDPTLARFEHDLVVGRANLEKVLSSALAIERDPRAFSERPDEVVAIALAGAGPYVLVEHGRVTGSALMGPAPAGIDRIIPLPEVNVRARQSLRSQRLVADVEARYLLDALDRDGATFSRAAFSELERWAPLLALHAYRQTVALQSIFDVSRDRPTARVHALGHLSVLAAAADPRDWLAEMAHTFTWRVWTPSFPLVRERIMRLAVRGGWVAARFGVGVIAPYLGRIARGQALHAFDAALALVAIATAADERVAIASELGRALAARTDERDGAHFAAIARSARFALLEPDAAMRHVAGRTSVLAAVATDDESAELDDAGYFRAILAMAALARVPASALFRSAN